MSRFPDSISNALARAMSLRLDRTHLIASNIANADTPGFTPVDMNFQAALESELEMGPLAQTSERHLAGSIGGEAAQPIYFYDPNNTPGLDGNSVSIDQEMARMSENTLLYDTTARALQKRLGLIRYAITDNG
jgi:flagellar basal-body rod protein FlgB